MGGTCIQGIGCPNGRGYLKKRGRYVHRAAYEAAHGPIPPGLQIDHLCGNRTYVNPLHLEAVTQQKNIRRSGVAAANRARILAQVACIHGHPYSAANTYRRPDGFRGCRTCRRANSRAYRRRAA